MEGRAVRGGNGSLFASSSYCESGEVASLSLLSLSNPPPTLSSSSSSFSSTRSSLRILPLVRLLAIDPVRLLPQYRLFHTTPIPKPEEATEEDDDLRARTRSSMALSRARASCATSATSRSSSTSASDASLSSIARRRPHCSSSAAMMEERSEKVGELAPPDFNALS